MDDFKKSMERAWIAHWKSSARRAGNNHENFVQTESHTVAGAVGVGHQKWDAVLGTCQAAKLNLRLRSKSVFCE